MHTFGPHEVAVCCSVLRAPEETMTGNAAGSDQTSIMLGLQEQVRSSTEPPVPFSVLSAGLSHPVYASLRQAVKA